MTSRSIVEIADSIGVLGLLLETEIHASTQRRLDGDGCDEGCGICGAEPEGVCWFHQGARAAWPRRIAP
ncbi:MAG: hypothetical protein V4498_02630 [candidate division FCPU426 bacterium]